MPLIDLKHLTFPPGCRWTVLRFLRVKGGRAYWLCRCACGTRRAVPSNHLRSGHTKSCGCYFREAIATRRITHGQSRTKVYRAWASMRQRCYNPKDPGFHYYGGRGIRVCAAWRRSFAAFLRDMGLPPSPLHSLGRSDNDGNYTPKNCRWELPKDQTRNKRSTRMLTHKGKTMCLKDWATHLSIGHSVLSRRLKRGLSVHEALSLKTMGSRSPRASGAPRLVRR